MATRSRIAIENEDGTVTSIYCHWDGYPENNGRLLLEHYQDRSKLEQLIALGDISSLGEEVSTDLPHSFDKPVSGVTVAYHRDRGEQRRTRKDRCAPAYFGSDFEEYGYLFTQQGEWLVKSCHDRKGVVPLNEVIQPVGS